jgi:hypothetical protein
MAEFNFKQVIRENLYNQKYSHQDKVKIILNEGQTLLLEREIHEGILDFIKNWIQDPKKDKQDISNLRDQIGAWIDRGPRDDPESREILINYYVKHLDRVPAEFLNSDAAIDGVGASLEAAAEGDDKEAAEKLKNTVGDLGRPKSQGRKRKRVRDRSGETNRDDVRFPQQTADDIKKDAENDQKIKKMKGLAGSPGEFRWTADAIAAASIRQALMGDKGSSAKRLKLMIRKALVDKGIPSQKSDEIFPVIFDLMKRSAEEMKGKQIKVDEIIKLKKSIRKIIKEATQDENKK